MGRLKLPVEQRVIVPLDVPDEFAAIALVDRLPQVGFWKVGLELFVSSGSSVLSVLKSRNKQIFLDLKLHDIPNTMAGACRGIVSYGVDFLTLHATAGQAGLKAAQTSVEFTASQVGLTPPKLLAVTLLTSLNARTLAFELKIPLELPEYVLQMALLAQSSSLSGVICSPQEVEQIRQTCGDDFLVVCPGVRPTWADAIDQQRVLTPSEAFLSGADYLVIGRPITQAEDPKIAFDRICEELAAVS